MAHVLKSDATLPLQGWSGIATDSGVPPSSGAVAAPLPANEPERLAALRGYAVLDTPPEPCFDDLTHLAAQLCATPVALISLVDETRQWFKSRLGLELEGTSREVGFCPHALLRPEPLVIPDATADARFQGNPLVTLSPGIRFYAGAPLLTPRGQVLGTVCVIDYVPRQLTPAQLQGLEALARQVVSQLELRRANHEQQRLIQELRISQERIDILQRATHDVIWDWDLETHRLLWNPRITQLLGYSQEQFGSGGWWVERFHPADRARVKEGLDRALSGDASLWSDEFRFRRADGSWARVLSRCAIQRDAEGKPQRLIGVGVDISEREELRARVALSDRLASVGTLAAGVAHEINNPLAYVMANLDYALGEAREAVAGARPTGELIQVLQEAHEGAERIRLIVRDLKTFSRPADERMEWLDIHQALDSAVTMAWNEIRHRARLVKQYERVPLVYANEGRLGQVFLNLLVNAAHAIPEGAADQQEIRLHTCQDAEGRVVIEVHDTGGGIPEAIRSRIFEPFFTTKRVGEGTGLGLSICHALVTNMHGELLFESEPGRGTVFRVLLPSPESQQPAPEPPAARREDTAARRGRILVVDDEAKVLSALERRLSQTHEVVVFERAQAALAWMEQGQPWDVVLCDVMMPEMTGVEFYAALARRWPERARDIVFVTGGAFTATAREFLDRVSNARLEKPFDFQALHALVEERLRERV